MEELPQCIVELRSVSKRYGEHRALEDFSLEVRRGEFLTLLGPSGSGKTTILRLVAGFEQPQSGQILINGRDASPLPPYRRNVNTVFQHYALFPHLNVFRNVAFGLEQKKLPSAEIRQRVRSILEMVELPGKEDRDPHQLSGGERQRVALARALVLEPAVLLLDEPLGALDQKLRQQMQVELKRLRERLGITFIFVTHDQQEARTMTDRIVVMNEGAIEQVGTPSEIYNSPRTRFVASFIGTLNLLEGRILDACAGAVEIDGQRATTRRDLNGAKSGDSRAMALRPEALRLGAGGEDRNTLAGVIEDVAVLGAVVRVRVRLAQAAVIVDTFNSGADDLPVQGAPVAVNFGRDDLIVLGSA